MTTGEWFIVYVTGGVMLIAACFYIAVHMAYKDGHNAGRDYERNRAAQKRIDAARVPARLISREPPAWVVYDAGRHAPWQPRVTVTRDTLSFAGGPATVPIAHNGRTPSGELRALVHGTDVFIENMQRDGNAYRRQLAGSGPRGGSTANNGPTGSQGPGMAGNTNWQLAELLASQPNQWRDGQ